METEFHGNYTENLEDDCNIIEENIEQFNNTISIEKSSEKKVKIFNQINKKFELRRIPVPPHRFTPLKNSWDKIVTTIVVSINYKGKYETINSNEYQKKMC